MKKLLIIALLLISFLSNAQINIGEDGLYYDIYNNVFTGVLTEQHENDKLKLKMDILDGKLHGFVEYYFDSGRKQEIRAYEEGEMHGIWKTWNDEGVKIAEASYRNNLKDGKWYVWSENGVKLYEMEYTEGKKVGVWYIWNEKGELISEKDFNSKN